MNDITLLSAAQLSGATATISTASPGKPGSKSPHCKVCGDESSGFHYGVDSCEGCKGFFRRCITQGMTHKCANEEKCEITPFTRNSCQFCRLRKCFEVGMSREASRLGRRPKRLKDVSGEQNKSHSNLPIAPYPTPAEMYRLRMSELQKMLQANGTFKAELMDAFLSAAKESFRDHAKHPSTNSSSETQQSAQQQQQQQQPTYSQASVVTSTGIQPQFKAESGYSSLSSPSSSKSQSPSQDLNSAASMSNNGMQILDMFNVPGLDDITPTTSPNSSNLPESVNSPLGDQLLDFNEFLMEQITIKSEPDLSPCGGVVNSSLIPNHIEIKEEYINVLREVQKPPTEVMRRAILTETPVVVNAHLTTTINHKSSVAAANEQVDYNLINKPGFYEECSNAQAVWGKFLNAMAPEIENVVKFCKKIPGFKEIDQEDQIKLLKRGSFDVLLARFTVLVNPDTQEMLDPTLTLRCPRRVVENMPMGVIIKEFYNISEVLKPLDLSDGEIAIFSAILIMSPDRVGPKNKMAVSNVKKLLHYMLYELLKTNHHDPDSLFVEVLSTIPMFQVINDRHADTLNNIKMNAPAAFEAQFPPLHKEVFDL